MSNTVIDFSSLEPLKDNIKPTRRGRTAQELAAIIKASNSTKEEHETSFQAKEEKYRHAIDNDTSDDPLALWADYLNFIQTAFYNLSPAAKLLPALEQCLNTFLNEPKYADDLRYIKLWCLLCESVDDCLRPYRLMLFKNIGTNRAVFYLDYAKALYLRRHFSAAEKILQQGIDHGAQPQEHLNNRLQYLVRLRAQREEKEGQEQDQQYDFHVPISARRLQIVDLITGETRDTSSNANIRSISQSGTSFRQPSTHNLAQPSRRLQSKARSKQPTTSATASTSDSFSIYEDDDSEDDDASGRAGMSGTSNTSSSSRTSSGNDPGKAGIRWNHMESYHSRRQENVQPFTGNMTKPNTANGSEEQPLQSIPDSCEAYSQSHQSSSSASSRLGARSNPHASVSILPSSSASSQRSQGAAPSFNSRIRATAHHSKPQTSGDFEIWQDE